MDDLGLGADAAGEELRPTRKAARQDPSLLQAPEKAAPYVAGNTGHEDAILHAGRFRATHFTPIPLRESAGDCGLWTYATTCFHLVTSLCKT